MRELDGQLVVHDHRTDSWHTLDAAASAVYQAADGRRDLGALATATGLTTGQVEDALASLSEADLVSVPAGMSRRSLLAHGAGIAGVAGVLTVVAPVAAGAISGQGGGGGTGGGQAGSVTLLTSAPPNGSDPTVQQYVSGQWVAASSYINAAYNNGTPGGPISGTNYVGGPDGPVGTPIRFRVQFVLPANFTSVTLTGEVRADNDAEVKATDGFSLGVLGTTGPGAADNSNYYNGNTPLTFSGSTNYAPHFSPGTNYLFFDVYNAPYNGDNPYMLDFKITVTYS